MVNFTHELEMLMVTSRSFVDEYHDGLREVLKIRVFVRYVL